LFGALPDAPRAAATRRVGRRAPASAVERRRAGRLPPPAGPFDARRVPPVPSPASPPRIPSRCAATRAAPREPPGQGGRWL